MMEEFALYLLKSVIWLSAFALIYYLFLRNERYFLLNRFYLVAGILASFLFPFISIHYTVIIPAIENITTGDIRLSGIENPESSGLINLSFLMTILYVIGSLLVSAKLFRQSKTAIRVIKNADVMAVPPVKLIRTAEYPVSFSFFSYVFVNPSVTDLEAKEIMNHEMAHIRQKHWVDLVLVELLCMLQWFNPIVWIYIRFIRQNHEYLADEVALQRSTDPAIYRAALLNQMVGSPVIILANSFNYSITKKRFNMMKNIIRSPYRKMKLLLILPVIAIVLYSFAKPEYRYVIDNDQYEMIQIQTADQDPVTKPVAPQQAEKKVIKSISDPGAPPPPPPPPLYVIDGKISEKHYNSVKKENTKSIKVLKSEIAIEKYGDKAKYGAIEITTNNPGANNLEEVEEKDAEPIPPPLPPPPPPPPPPIQEVTKIGSNDGKNPLIVIDGKITDIDISLINPNSIQAINVIKDIRATDKYGEKAKDGVIEITTKKDGSYIQEYLVPSTGSSNDKIQIVGYENGNTPGIKLRTYRGDVITKPMIILDGDIYENSLDGISPNDIKSISVLKGEAAVKRYGEKAKEGVIIITSKKK